MAIEQENSSIGSAVPQGRFHKVKAYISRNRYTLGTGVAAGVAGVFGGPLACGFGLLMGSFLGANLDCIRVGKPNEWLPRESERIVVCSLAPFLATWITYLGIDAVKNHNMEAVKAAQTEICKGALSVEKPFKWYNGEELSFKAWRPTTIPVVQKAGFIDKQNGGILGFTRVVFPYDKAGLTNGPQPGDTIFDCQYLKRNQGTQVWKPSKPFNGTVRIAVDGGKTEVVEFTSSGKGYQVLVRRMEPTPD
jgi:hypothetical protein